MKNSSTDAWIKPPEGSLFSSVDGPLGLRLAMVFGNEGTDGRCPFHGIQCVHCDIGAGEGMQFTPAINKARLEYLAEHYRKILPELRHLVIYNYGSTLNDGEFSPETRKAILEFADTLPKLHRISFDSREHFITPDRIGKMLEWLRGDRSLSITLGLESQNEQIRTENLQKKMSREHLEASFSALAQFNPRTAVEMNILFQPPGVTGQDAIEEAIKTVEFGLKITDRYGVRVDFNFHPYYPSIKGTRAFPDHPRAMLEHAICALIKIIRKIKAHNGSSTIFVGWNDEGHDLQQGVKKMKQLLYSPAFAAFNRSQNEIDLQI